MKKIIFVSVLMFFLSVCVIGKYFSENDIYKNKIEAKNVINTDEIQDLPLFMSGTSKGKTIFLCPSISSDENSLVKDYQWMIDSQAKAHRVAFERFYEWSCSNREEGFYYSGAVFSLNDTSEAKHFRENNLSGELLVSDKYFTTHKFLSYESNKYNQEKTQMSDDFKKQMEEKFSRKIKSTCQVMKLKDRNSLLAIAEFELDEEKGEAMIVYAWIENDKIITTHVQTKKFDINYFTVYDSKKVYHSVWRVDDDGEYEIPNISACAVDNDAIIDIFMEQIGVEGTYCNIMRIKNGKIEFIHRERIDYWSHNYC